MSKVMCVILFLFFLGLLGNVRTILALVKNLTILTTNNSSPKFFFFPSNIFVLVFHTERIMTS